MTTGNIGEWSELYTLFKLLGDGRVYAGDANMNKLSIYYPIISIIREESKRYTYNPDEDKRIVVIYEDGTEVTQIPMNIFLKEARYLLGQLKQDHYYAAFSVPNTEKFMKEVRCESIKVPNAKADIQIIIHDLRTRMTPQLGFSIKSQLGGASTLLNASVPTNFQMKIVGLESTEEAKEIDDIPKHLYKINEIYKRGYHLEFVNVPSNVFRNNLLFIDGYMPVFIGNCLIEDSINNTNNSDVAHIVAKVAEKNPLGYRGNNTYEFYAHKMKQLLVDCALGMVPSKPWNGRFDANGGYLVVRKDGEVICYHFYNRNDVEDYLYNNTRFERASRTRHKFGYIYKLGNEFYINLNLQIRFKQ